MANQQAQDLRRVYYHIIDDVITKMKPEFVQENVDESVLHSIRQRWAQKLTERGIISEAEPEEAKRDGDKDVQLVNNVRKRPHDGAGPSGPVPKQELNANPAAAVPQQQPQQLLQPNAAMLQHQRQLPQAAMTHQQLQQLQQQQRLHAGAPLQQQLAAQAAAGVPGMQQRMQGVQMAGALQGMPGGLTGLPAGVQLPGGAAVPANNLQLGLQGLVRMQQQQQQGLPGVQAGQGLQSNIAQLQQMLAQNPALMHQLRAQQQLQQQAQQQQRQQQLLAQQQQLAQQQRHQTQVYNSTIPQRDGASDEVPAPLAAVAAAAGVNAQQLHALVPSQVSSALAAAHKRCSSNSSNPLAAAVQTTNPHAAAGRGSSSSSSKKASASKQQRHRRQQQRRIIPQVDGNGDEDEDGFEEEEEDVVEDFEEVEVPAEEPQVDSDDNEADAEELKKLDDDLLRQEAADQEAIENVGFALYEKVQRSKNRWRCTLKYGVFYINGKEYMFNKAMTDLTF